MLAAAEAKTTTLLQWFDLNKRDPSAHQYLYQDIPAHYTWNERKWNLRQNILLLALLLAECIKLPPHLGERFYLRLLLTAVTSCSILPTPMHYQQCGVCYFQGGMHCYGIAGK